MKKQNNVGCADENNLIEIEEVEIEEKQQQSAENVPIVATRNVLCTLLLFFFNFDFFNFDQVVLVSATNVVVLFFHSFFVLLKMAVSAFLRNVTSSFEFLKF